LDGFRGVRVVVWWGMEVGIWDGGWLSIFVGVYWVCMGIYGVVVFIEE